jgi:4'-phosphopantetheinyl transferase
MEQADRSFEGFVGGGWTPMRAFVPLGTGEVQIWRVRAVGDGPLYESCLSRLSLDELERLGRMRAGTARDEFVIGRGCLRALLGLALEKDPRSIIFSAGLHGKPSVEGVEFNVSHSKGLILLALSRSSEIGIDVEWMDPGIEAMEIAQDTFAPGEIAQIAAKEGEERVRAFYRCWVRKEAVTKAHGQGITLSLKDFQVDLASEHETSVLISTESGDKQSFSVRGVPLGESFYGALATTLPGLSIRLFELSPAMIIAHLNAI